MNNVYIFDYKDRRIEIYDELLRLRDEQLSCAMFIDQIFESKNVFQKSTNKLWELSEPLIVFLHLGNGDKCGNIRSMEFYEKKLKNNKIAVIGYTGGSEEDCRMPDVFQEYVGEEKWNCYLNNINRPADLNLAAFFKEWSILPQASPPFDALRLKNFNHLIALSILCQGYIIAHGGKSLRNPAWWKKYYESIDVAFKLKGKESECMLNSLPETESPAWWDRIKKSDQILLEINELQGDGTDKWKKSLKALVNFIETHKMTENYSEHELSPLVEDAYKAYCAFEDNKARYL